MSEIVPLPRPRALNDNQPFFWIVCNQCREQGLVGRLDNGRLTLLCVNCNADLTDAIAALFWTPRPTG